MDIFDESSQVTPEKEPGNIAFIDGQNLHLGAKDGNWSIDHKKLRIYLRDKYHIASSLYKNLGGEFFAYLEDIKAKIAYGE